MYIPIFYFCIIDYIILFVEYINHNVQFHVYEKVNINRIHDKDLYSFIAIHIIHVATQSFFHGMIKSRANNVSRPRRICIDVAFP